jgi:hypothetical protein
MESVIVVAAPIKRPRDPDPAGGFWAISSNPITAHSPSAFCRNADGGGSAGMATWLSCGAVMVSVLSVFALATPNSSIAEVGESR